MLDKVLTQLLGTSYFRRFLAIATLFIGYGLTEQAFRFAWVALQSKADLMGTAGILTAITALPLGFVTLVYKNYVEQRIQDDINPSGKDS